MGSIMSGIKEEFVRKVFSALNKEGKHLPMPSEEEIVAFARNNQFISRHDVTIPDNMRAKLVKQWQKAEMERPSGGTFHAWKHTLVESVVRWRRTAAVATLGGVLAFTSACSGGAINNDNSPAPTSSPTSISQTATPSASPSASASVPAAIGTPAPTAGVVTTSKGSYLQSTISPDDPAMKVNQSIVDPSVQSMDPADLQAAQQSVVKFTAEEGIDSTLNGGGENTDQWWEKNKSKLSPTYHTEMLQTLKEGKPFVMNENWQNSYDGKYQYITSADKPRIYDRVITPKAIWSPSAGTVAVQMEVSYKMPVKPGVGKTGTGIQSTAGTMTYSATKDANGNWLIDGYDHEMKTTEG
jgi:hypothetical protein